MFCCANRSVSHLTFIREVSSRGRWKLIQRRTSGQCAEETLEQSVINGMSLSNISLTKGGHFGAQRTLWKSQQYVKGNGDERHPGICAFQTQQGQHRYQLRETAAACTKLAQVNARWNSGTERECWHHSPLPLAQKLSPTDNLLQRKH